MISIPASFVKKDRYIYYINIRMNAFLLFDDNANLLESMKNFLIATGIFKLFFQKEHMANLQARKSSA